MIVVSVGRGRVAPAVLSTKFLSMTTQPNISAINDTAFTTQPAVQTIPAAQGVTITAAINNGVGTQLDPTASGTLGGTLTAVTNAQGLATFTNLKITGTVADHVLLFTASTYTSCRSTLVTTTASAATKAGIRTNPAGAVTAVAFTTQPVIELQDVSGNPTGTGTTDVVAAKATGSGTLSGTTTKACVDGVATFTNLVLTGSGAHTLSFTPTGLTLATSNTVTIDAAPATALAMGTQPSGAVASTAFTIQPTVQLIIAGTPYTYAAGIDENPLSDGSKWTTPTGYTALKTLTGTFRCSNEAVICAMYVNSTGLTTVSSDQSSQVVCAAGSTGTLNVTVRDQGDGGLYYFGGTIGETTMSLFHHTAAGATNFLGVGTHTLATSDVVKLVAEGTTLSGYVNGVLVVTATNAALTGGRPGLMLYGDAQADTYSGTGLSVNHAQASVSVTVTKHVGVTGTLGGTASASTAANGLATFTNLSMSAVESGVTLDFASSGLTGVTSATINVVASAATQLAMVTHPASATDGSVFGTQPSVRLLDAAGSNVLTASVTITAVKQTGTGTLSGTATADTDANGIATWTNLSLANGGAGGTFTLRFSSGGLTTVDSASFAVAASGGLYPNRPANYTTTLRDLNFSQTVPANPGADRAIAGSNGWSMIYDQAGSLVKESDGTAPNSPSDVWKCTMASGTFGSSHGYGNIYTILPANTNALYLSLRLKWDSNFEWHPISNKFLWWTPGQVLIQSLEGGQYIRGEILDRSAVGLGAIWFNPSPNTAPTLGAWQHVEVLLIRGTTGTFKIWLNGVLRQNETNVNIPLAGGGPEFILENYRGGGGETKTRDSYIHYDHLMIAVP